MKRYKKYGNITVLQKKLMQAIDDRDLTEVRNLIENKSNKKKSSRRSTKY